MHKIIKLCLGLRYRNSQAGENMFSGGFKTCVVLKLLADKRKKLRKFLEGMERKK
jgi:hypothetical protein